MISKLRNYIRITIIFLHRIIYTKIYGMKIHSTARISCGAKLDKTNPKGIFIGEESYIASGAIIFSHDFSRSMHENKYIGKKCFIGANAIVMCGVKIGNECIIGAGTIVTKDIPDNCIAVGNPAKILKVGISTKRFGQLI